MKAKVGKGLCRAVATLGSVDAHAKCARYLLPDLWTDLCCD